jgi:hypothetical protein
LNILRKGFDIFVKCLEFLSCGHVDTAIGSTATYGGPSDSVINDLRGIPHTVKVERKGNELIVHIALTERPSWDRTGVILASEGWQEIGYGLKMQLTIASTNVILQKERIKLVQKPGILNRLRRKKIPMLEDKS